MNVPTQQGLTSPKANLNPTIKYFTSYLIDADVRPEVVSQDLPQLRAC